MGGLYIEWILHSVDRTLHHVVGYVVDCISSGCYILYIERVVHFVRLDWGALELQ